MVVTGAGAERTCGGRKSLWQDMFFGAALVPPIREFVYGTVHGCSPPLLLRLECLVVKFRFC